MFLSWTALLFVLVAAVVAWFWQDSLAARERANAAAMEACERMGLQFLDGTVAFARIGWIRGSGGWVVLRRTYVFDYTATSIERLQGFVVLSGHRVETVGYAPGETGRRTLLQPTVSPTPPANLPPNVLQLDQWRERNRFSAPPPRENREDRGDQRH